MTTPQPRAIHKPSRWLDPSHRPSSQRGWRLTPISVQEWEGVSLPTSRSTGTGQKAHFVNLSATSLFLFRVLQVERVRRARRRPPPLSAQ